MLTQFRAYQDSVCFYHLACELKLPRHLKDQLARASSSVSLLLAEGSGKQGFQDRRRFYQMALGSMRESQAVLQLARVRQPQIVQLADRLGAQIYCLCTWRP